jgi:hypothetical protein
MATPSSLVDKGSLWDYRSPSPHGQVDGFDSHHNEEKAMARNARNAAGALRKAQRIADKEAKRAQKQAELAAKASNKGQKRILKKKKVPPKPTSKKNTAKAQEAPQQPRSRSGRTIRTPAWLLT